MNGNCECLRAVAKMNGKINKISRGEEPKERKKMQKNENVEFGIAEAGNRRALPRR